MSEKKESSSADRSIDTLKQVLMRITGNEKAELSFTEQLEDDTKKIYDAVKDSKVLKDSYGNSLLDIGNASHSEAFNEYSLANNTLNWSLWLALYNGSWVFKRAIDKPAQDMVRAGISIQGPSQEEVEKLQKRVKTYGNDMTQLLMWGALFGGSVAFAQFDNFSDEDYGKAFNEKKVAAAKTMKFYVVDRWYGVSPDYNQTVTNMADVDYGKPKYYDITMPDGKTYKYHHDYVIRFEGRTAPKLIKNGMLQGWGYAEGAHIFNELARDEKLKNSIQSLVNKALIEVIKMSGMRGVFMGADNENEEQLKKRLEMVNWGRNYNSLTFLDKDDDYTQFSFGGLSGLSDLLEQNMWQIAAALEMQGVLFGDMKQGFQADSDAMQRYDDVIQGRCEAYLRPVYEKLLKYITTMLKIKADIEFSFNSLLMKKQDKERIEGIKDFTDLLSKLLEDGVINTKLYAKSLQMYATKGTVDFGLTDKEIEKLDDKFEQEMENIDLDATTKESEKDLSNIVVKK